METKTHFLRNIQIIILGICIALGAVCSSYLIAQAMFKIKRFSTEIISVTGSAEKKITSDYIVWRAEFSRRNPEMTVAYQQLKADLVVVKNYLLSKGVAENEITISQTETRVLYIKDSRGSDTNAVEGYSLSQKIIIASADVLKVSDVSRQATELIEQGIEMISASPEYFYLKLSDLKLELLEGATRDARLRAERVAVPAGKSVGVMRSAKMGVFQITPANSLEVSDWGVNDTSSYEKKANAVVRVDFAIS